MYSIVAANQNSYVRYLEGSTFCLRKPKPYYEVVTSVNID